MHWQSWRVALCCDSVDEGSEVSEGPQGEWRCSGAGKCGGAGSTDWDKKCGGPQSQRCKIYSVISKKNFYELMASLKALIWKPFIWVKEFLVDVIQIFQSIKFHPLSNSDFLLNSISAFGNPWHHCRVYDLCKPLGSQKDSRSVSKPSFGMYMYHHNN